MSPAFRGGGAGRMLNGMSETAGPVLVSCRRDCGAHRIRLWVEDLASIGSARVHAIDEATGARIYKDIPDAALSRILTIFRRSPTCDPVQIFRQKARMNRWLFSSWVCPVATLKFLSQKISRMWERHSVASFLVGCPGHIKRLGQSMGKRFPDESFELLPDAGLNASGWVYKPCIAAGSSAKAGK